MKLSDFIEELNIAIRQDGHDIYCNADTANMIKRHLKEQKKGEWIIDGHHIECNQCGASMCDTDREGDSIPRNFCPNCGVGMRGKQDE